MRQFHSLQDFFELLNSNIHYVVLRNYESFGAEGFLVDHPDIDLLCFDRDKALALNVFKSRGKASDMVHQYVDINGKYVQVDLRTIGDGYYCTEWEKELLLNRNLLSDSFYVPNTENYFYSLLYHVMVHKNEVTTEYKERLIKMKKDVTFVQWDASEAEKILCDYMRRKGYYFAYPENVSTCFNVGWVSGGLIEKSIIKCIKRKIYYVAVRSLGRVKSLFDGDQL